MGDVSVPETISSEGLKVHVKTPKRVLHFSDGTMEEFSTDDEDDAPDNKAPEEQIDMSKLTWGLWFSYKAWSAGTSTLAVVDTMGEYLASFFGITTPKYYFEIEEHKKRVEEQQKQQEQEDAWCGNKETEPITTPLSPLKDTPAVIFSQTTEL